MALYTFNIVTRAQAGGQLPMCQNIKARSWIPVYAGMTNVGDENN